LSSTRLDFDDRLSTTGDLGGDDDLDLGVRFRLEPSFTLGLSFHFFLASPVLATDSLLAEDEPERPLPLYFSV
jgi:hypothetical protein